MYFLLFLVIGVLTTPFASADSFSLRIVEFLYNAEGSDVGKEYILVTNVGSDPIDMTSVLFFEHGRKHFLRSGLGDTTLRSGETAVIVEQPSDFSVHYPSFSGSVLDSGAFSLNNTESVLELRYRDRLLHRVSYTKHDGANGDGNALFVSRDDTLSARRPFSGVSVPSVASSVQARLLVHPPVVFSASTASFSVRRGSDLLHGLWRFGDGTELLGSEVEHVYLYPGTYTVSFSEEGGGSVSLRKSLEVVFPQIAVHRIDGSFVRFSNHHPFSLAVSGWHLSSGESSFVFPEGSVVPARGSIVVPFSTVVTVPIFVVTAGGGQFDGSAFSFSDTVVVSEYHSDSSVSDVHSVMPAVSSEVHDPVSVDAVPLVSEQRRGVGSLFIWLSFLFGIIALGLAPFFIMRSEEQNVSDDSLSS